MVLTKTDSTAEVQERIRLSARCEIDRGLHRLSFHAMNTLCRVSFQARDARQAGEFQRDVLRWVGWFEARYSRFIPDSLISRINDAAGLHWVDVDQETDALFNLCGEMVFFTRGIFDPTALPLIRLWNWKVKPSALPGEAEIRTAQELVGWRKVERRSGGIFLPETGMSLDLGGIGKEYAVDRVLVMGLERDLQNILVDFGQDVRVHGQPPEKGAWHIGLQDPKELSRCWTGVAARDSAVATSGDGIRHFVHEGRRYGHIIDNRTGCPVNNGTLSVSVIAPYCTLAGILSTTAFILGPQEGIDLMRLCPGVEGCITTESTRNSTRGFHAYTTF